MTNIFLLSGDVKSEDRFTSSLHCLIENVPAIGQEIVDYITVKAGKVTSRFIESLDHPCCDDGNKPDFLLRCEDFDIICEHKLGSSLGKQQLERYLALAERRPKRTYLALITHTFSTIQDEVVRSSLYLCPDPQQRRFFSWQELYPILSQHTEPLAQDFVEYMAVLGMQPPSIEKWQDLFICSNTAETFKNQWTEVQNFFVEQAKPRRVGFYTGRYDLDLGLGVQYPLPWLHLLYFAPYQKQIRDLKRNLISAPYLCADAWVREDDPHLNVLNQRKDEMLKYAGGEILAHKGNPEKRADWNKNLVNAFWYATPLDPILEKEPLEMQQLLLDFAKTVFDHIQWAGEGK